MREIVNEFIRVDSKCEGHIYPEFPMAKLQ